MSLIEILFLGIALAMDALAISICTGVKLKSSQARYALKMALVFGVMQGVMPIIGWIGGSLFSSFIASYSGIISLAILAFIGINMIREALSDDDEDEIDDVYNMSGKTLFALGVATSIDALAVGVSFSLLDTPILFASTLIAIITFIICYFGVILGKKLGEKFSTKAEIAGGIILILIGLNIFFS